MWSNSFSNGQKSFDITAALQKLVDAGFTEKEIADFARLRAHYARISNHLLDYPSAKFDEKEKVRLGFYHWLYQNGRIDR